MKETRFSVACSAAALTLFVACGPEGLALDEQDSNVEALRRESQLAVTPNPAPVGIKSFLFSGTIVTKKGQTLRCRIQQIVTYDRMNDYSTTADNEGNFAVEVLVPPDGKISWGGNTANGMPAGTYNAYCFDRNANLLAATLVTVQ